MVDDVVGRSVGSRAGWLTDDSMLALCSMDNRRIPLKRAVQPLTTVHVFYPGIGLYCNVLFTIISPVCGVHCMSRLWHGGYVPA